MLKRILTIYLTSVAIAFGEVDYWGFSVKPKTSPSSTVVKEENKEKSKEEILKESIKWYEEKVKREKPPIEYLYFKNPEKYKDVYIAWLKWKNEKGRDLLRYTLAELRKNAVDIESAVKYLKNRGYVILYFYKPDCPYCRAETPQIEYLSQYFKIYTVNIYENPIEAQKWRIVVTPTMIAVSPKEKRAFRVEGYMDALQLIKVFYEKVRGE